MFMHARIGVSALLVASLAWAIPSQAKDALALMQEVDKRLRARDELVRYDMELYEGARPVHTRKLVRMDKTLASKNSTVVRFTEPDSVKNVGLLIEDTGAAVNDIWSYTASTRSLRRIAGTQKQNWFMGTEFTYEDFEDFKLKAYDFVEVAVQSPCLAWAQCTVVEATPKPGGEAALSGYTKKRYFIEAASQFPVQVEYLDARGVAKRLTTEALRRYDAHFRPTAQTMHNLSNDRRTRLVVREVAINRGLPDTNFTQRYLRSEDEL